MAVRTQALDRVLEALSPALAAELDRVVTETRDALEKEFQKRLQTAVKDAETATQNAAQLQLQQAVVETRDAVQKQVTEQLEQQFKKTLETATNQLKKTLEATTTQLKSEFSSERTRLQEQLDQWRIFAETQKQLADASSQAEILARFLKLAESFAPNLAVYVTKADGLALWKSRGKTIFPEIISEETTDPEFYFKAINVRGKIVAAVYGAPPHKAEALDFLTASMARAIEVFGLKLRTPVPKPVVASETTVAVAASAPSAASTSASAPDGDDPKLHAEARRTARLLISEIKLYHEQELKEGREHSDIYQRLRKEIDSGREQYNQKVSSAVLTARDYFHEELVRILTENDASRLGAAYPGPMNS